MDINGHIIVTGHTGVVGARLTGRLAARKIPLVMINSRGAFVMRPDKQPEPVCEVFDRPALLELFNGVKACVHLAAAHSGAVSIGVVGALLKNAILTDYFAGLAAEAEAPFIYASSGAIYYQFADSSVKVLSEDTAVNVDPQMVKEVLDHLEQVRRTGDYGGAYDRAEEVFGPKARISSISPRAGYAFGKYIGELSTASALSGKRYLILRLGNVFGPGDQYDRIVPKFIRTAKTGASAVVFDWSRNFIWIDDLCYIIEKAIDGKMPDSNIMNTITPGNTIKLWDLAQMINSLVGGPGGEFILNLNEHEPNFEWSTNYPEMLNPNPVKLREGLALIVSSL